MVQYIYPIEKRDWRTCEQQLMKLVKGVIHNLEPLTDEATNIEIHRGPGRPPELDLKQSLTIILIKHYYCERISRRIEFEQIHSSHCIIKKI